MKYIREFQEIGWRSVYGHAQFNKSVQNDLSKSNATDSFSIPGEWTWVGTELIYITNITHGVYKGIRIGGDHVSGSSNDVVRAATKDEVDANFISNS